MWFIPRHGGDARQLFMDGYIQLPCVSPNRDYAAVYSEDKKGGHSWHMVHTKDGQTRALELPDGFADAQVLVILERHAAFHAVAHLADVVLEMAQAFDVAFVNNYPLA